MVEIAVLETTPEKEFQEEKIVIGELSCEIHLIRVPYQKKVKRRNKGKLLKILLNYEYVLTSDEKLTGYVKGASTKSLLYYYPLESILYVTHNAAYTQTAIVAAGVSPLLKKTILLLGSFFRIVTVYTVQNREMEDLIDGLYSSIGLPVHIKELNMECRPQEDYLIRISEDITVLERKTGKEISDISIKFNYPLSKYKALPLLDIMKIILENGGDFDLFRGGKVKIVGEISK